MKNVETQVLVVGGGATGTGVVRDLAMRGYDSVLVEKRDLAHGTTGRYHGLLHSGCRYVVKDPIAARECIRENKILRHIMPHCIEDTGGFFVLTPWDDPAYVPLFLDGCQKADIHVEEVGIDHMLRQEPFLSPDIVRCFQVPDAAADSFLAAESNAESARQYGAKVWTYHEVTGLILEGDRIVGVVCHDLVKDQEVTIRARMMINTTGAWAGLIGAGAGLTIPVLCGKGTMIAMNHRLVRSVISRCRVPTDGGILVPSHTVAVMGTTDVKVDHPERFVVEPWEIRLMLEEGDRMVPGLKDMRVLRSWAGVRPLYQGTQETVSDRDVSRNHVLLDHEIDDGIAGMLTMIGGKWTTYRLMAEEVVDRVGEKLDNPAECRTHLEPLPGAEKARYHAASAPLVRMEQEAGCSQLVCECELVTRSDLVRSISQGEARAIDDIRRDVRLGMGACQGGFCTYRATGILHSLRRPEAPETNVALRDFLQERWKGLLPILAGQQLRQERLNELIYLDVLNADRLPGPQSSRLACVMYEPAANESTLAAIDEVG